MREFQEKRELKRIIFSRASVIALFVLLIFLSVFTVKTFLKYRKAVLKSEQIAQETEDMLRKTEDLREKISRLETAGGLEEEMRGKFNVAKPGEEVLTIIDKTKGNDKMNEEKGARGFFSKIWSWIKNIF